MAGSLEEARMNEMDDADVDVDVVVGGGDGHVVDGVSTFGLAHPDGRQDRASEGVHQSKERAGHVDAQEGRQSEKEREEERKRGKWERKEAGYSRCRTRFNCFIVQLTTRYR